ncbi:MAG: pyrroline-5-carboxylate reductase [Gammaproteobacteria bacterium]
MFTDTRIAFIGGGNMGSSLIGGLLKKGFAASQIRVAEPSSAQRERVRQQFAVDVGDDNTVAVQDAQVVVFAVKPQMFRDAARSLAPALARTRPLIISIAAGILEPDICRWLGFDAAIVRAMPNTPALIGAGAAALYTNRFVTAEQRALAEQILTAVGIAVWLEDETLMDAVTAVSGSGPAYFFLLIELLEAAARELGLPMNVARELVTQTACGAARMARESAEDAVSLRQQVTSPGGTTAAALDVLEQAKLREIFRKALTAARDRGAELSREFSKDEP